MKFIKFVNSFLLTILVVSCGPAALPTPTPDSTSLDEQTEIVDAPEITMPNPWENLNKEWTYFKGSGYFSPPVYDPKGFIWLKNNLGIYRMNVESGKYEFLGKPESFSSSSNFLVYFEDTVWFSPSVGHVSHFENGVWETEEIEAGYAYGLYVFGDELWFLGNEGIRFRKDGEWRPFIFPEEYTRGYGGMARSGDGSLWFSSYEAVLEYDGVNWIEHKNLNGINRMVTLDNGEVLFIYEGLILEYKNGKISPLVLPEDTYRYSLRNSFIDPKGDFWFQTYSYNYNTYNTYILNENGVRQLPAVVFDDFPDPELYSPVAMIPQGWVFTGRKGVYLFTGEKWREYPFEHKTMIDMQGLNTPIGFTPDGKLWFISGSYPLSYDGKKVDSSFKESACNQYYDQGLLTPDGLKIWLTSSYRSTVCLFDLETGEYFEGDIPFNPIGADVAPDGGLWFLSRSGFIARITPYTFRKGDYRLIEPIVIGGDDLSQPLTPDRILVDSLGAVWVYVHGYGIYRYKDDVWKNFGMTDIDKTSFDVDSNGDIWVGKPGKLLKHTDEGWVEYPQACICPTKLTISPQDVFWFVNGCNGVYRYNGTEWVQFDAEKFGGFVPSQIMFAPDGATWFFSYDSWARYQPEE